MGYLLYGFVKLIEATLFYFLAFIVAKQLHSPIPPIGSQAYIIFIIVWPFASAVLSPGLHRIPIIGEIFVLLEQLARQGLGKR